MSETIEEQPPTVTMTEREFNLRRSETSVAGEAVGFAEAAKLVLARATEAFARNQDEIARVLRDVSRDLEGQSKVQRKRQNELRKLRGEEPI